MLKRSSRPVRRVAQWLVGQPHLLAHLEDQRAMMIAHGEWIADLQSLLRTVEANVSLKVDAVLEQLDGSGGVLSEERFRDLLEAEVNRLDGYVAYRLDEFAAARAENDAEVGVGTDRAAVVPADLDVLVSGHELDLIVPAGDLGLLAYLLRHGPESVEPGPRAVLQALVRPGDVVADVGANIGLHAVPLGVAVGSEGRLICVEPLPRAAVSLRRSLRLNGLAGRAEVHEVALADTRGAARLHVTDHGPVSSLFPVEGEVGEPLEVVQTTLDDLIPAGGRLDVVKLDVEGAEPLVWRGMSRVRSENPRLAVVLEWSASHFARCGHDPAAFLGEIVAAGYTVEVVDEVRHGETMPVEPDSVPGLEGANLLLRPTAGTA